MSGLVRSASHSRPIEGIPSGPLGAMKPTMVDANDLPPKRPECLSRLAPSRGNLAGISSLQRRNTEDAAWPALIVKCAASNHLNLKFSRLSSLIDRQPISFMSRSISL